MLGYMTQYAVHSYIDVVDGTCSFESSSFVRWLEFIGSFPDGSTSDWENSILFPATMFSSVSDYTYHRESLQDYPVYVGYPSDFAGGPCASAQSSFGISAATEYPEACWDFMKLLLEEPQQSGVISSLGFPVLRSALDAQFDAAMEADISQDSITSEEAGYLLALIDGLSYTRFRYEDVQTIIQEEGEAFFAGDATAETAAERIQGRVSIYLSEKQ